MKPRKGVNPFRVALQFTKLPKHIKINPAGEQIATTRNPVSALDHAQENGYIPTATWRKARRHVMRCLNHGVYTARWSHVRYIDMSQWLFDCEPKAKALYRACTTLEDFAQWREHCRIHAWDWFAHMADQWERREIL